MEQIVSSSLKIKLTDLKKLNSYINLPGSGFEVDKVNQIQYSIEGTLGLDKDSNTIVSQVKFNAFYQENKKPTKSDLFGLTSRTFFIIDNIDQVILNDRLVLPKDFATKIFNISIGNTRGLLKSLVEGNVNYANFTLPLITTPLFEDVK